LGTNPLPPCAQAVVDCFPEKRRAIENNATRQISFLGEHKTGRPSGNAPSELVPSIAPEIPKEPLDD
jgi:hypothetical protein